MTNAKPSYRSYSNRIANPDLEGPHDGVPEWLDNSLWHWIEAHLTHQSSRTGRSVNVTLIHAVERNARINLGQTDDEWELLEELRHKTKQSGDLFLDIIQAILDEADYNYAQNVARAAELDKILLKGGSLWSTPYDEENKTAGLVRRVDPTMQAAADEIVQASDNAAQLLSKAWSAAYGRNPNPSHAYRGAVSAIEAALWTIISPNNNRATLGTMIGELKTRPETWETAIIPKNTNGGVQALTAMLELVWNGQTDRHGTATPVTPSSEAAEAAVSFAVTVIQWARIDSIKTV